MLGRRAMFVVAGLLAGLLGCASTATTRDAKDRLITGGFFDPARVERFFEDVRGELGAAIGDPMYASDRYAMRKSAFAERDDQAWLWCGLALAPGDTAWISRPGAFEITLLVAGEAEVFEDEGVLVALDEDERRFLDSSRSPLSLTAGLARGDAPARVPLLVRLPSFDIARSRPVSIRPISGPWRCTWTPPDPLPAKGNDR